MRRVNRQSGLLAARRRSLALMVLLALPSTIVAQINTTTVLAGRVVVRDIGAALPYASITINGKNAQFTDSLGQFHIEGIAAGDVTIRARHIGFAPAEQVVHITRGDTVRVSLQMTRLAIQLPPVYAVSRVCTDPGAPGRKSDPGLVQLYGQLRENADHFRLLSQTNPYVYQSERQFVTTLNDSVIERTPIETLGGTSVRDWKYEPGHMIVENKTTTITNMHLPGLADFADDNFAKAHCFDYAGIVELDSMSLIQIDFTPDRRIKAPDVEGSIYLDPKNYQIRRAQITLTKVPYALSGEITGHTVTTFFTEVVPGIPIIGAFRAEVMKLRVGEVRTELQRVVEVHFINAKPD
jgi:hypothetical protein